MTKRRPRRKPDQRQSQFARQLHRETRRRRHRRQQRNARSNRLLHDLKSPAAADHQYLIAERHAAFQERPADNLVHGIVSADVFAQGEQFAAGAVKRRRRVQPASSAKNSLCGAQSRRQLAENFRDRTAKQLRGGANPAAGGARWMPSRIRRRPNPRRICASRYSPRGARWDQVSPARDFCSAPYRLASAAPPGPLAGK